MDKVEDTAPKKKKYVIVTAVGLPKLEDEVNRQLDLGATLVGGPFRVPSDERRDVWYAQGVLNA